MTPRIPPKNAAFFSPGGIIRLEFPAQGIFILKKVMSTLAQQLLNSMYKSSTLLLLEISRLYGFKTTSSRFFRELVSFTVQHLLKTLSGTM